MDSDATHPPNESPAPITAPGSAAGGSAGRPPGAATDGTRPVVAPATGGEPEGSQKRAGDTAPPTPLGNAQERDGGEEDGHLVVETTSRSAANGENAKQVRAVESAVSQTSPGSNLPLGKLSLGSLAVHADDHISAHSAVAPALHVSTTFRYNKSPGNLVPLENVNPLAPHDSHCYSRDSHPSTTRLEAILTAILGGQAITYASGLAAFHALVVYLNPRRVAISGGYHGCHGVLRIMQRITGLELLPLDCPASDLRPGDLVHVETPLNPTGEARNLTLYAKKAKAAGAYLSIDATFGPPPLQEPFRYGVDVIMHSGTKYLGGHSDMLCGVLAVHPDRADWAEGLRADRVYLGSVMGSMEGWLGLRSLRTLELRVERQSRSTQSLVDWLASELQKPGSAVSQVVDRIQHASLQKEDLAGEDSWLRQQMPRGFGPVFAIWMKNEEQAKHLPSKLRLFHHATSLGGVESLIEWRAMSDAGVDKRLLRVSVGVEGWEDLRDDFRTAIEALREREG